MKVELICYYCKKDFFDDNILRHCSEIVVDKLLDKYNEYWSNKSDFLLCINCYNKYECECYYCDEYYRPNSLLDHYKTNKHKKNKLNYKKNF